MTVNGAITAIDVGALRPTQRRASKVNRLLSQTSSALMCDGLADHTNQSLGPPWAAMAWCAYRANSGLVVCNCEHTRYPRHDIVLLGAAAIGFPPNHGSALRIVTPGF